MSIPPWVIFAAFAVDAVGQLAAGRAARQQGEMQAELYNREAKRKRELSEREASDFDRTQSALMARRRAQGGATGVDATGTPLLVDEDLAEEIEYQRLKIISGGLASEATLRTQGVLERHAGKAKQKASYLRAGSSLIKGGVEGFGT